MINVFCSAMCRQRQLCNVTTATIDVVVSFKKTWYKRLICRARRAEFALEVEEQWSVVLESSLVRAGRDLFIDVIRPSTAAISRCLHAFTKCRLL